MNKGVYRGLGNRQYGADGIVAQLRRIEKGEIQTACFAVADHPSIGDRVYHYITVGRAVVNGTLSWRFCDEHGSPDGPSSSSLCDTPDLALAAARLAASLSRLCAQYGVRARIFYQSRNPIPMHRLPSVRTTTTPRPLPAVMAGM